MKRVEQIPLARLRALIGALFLLVGALSTPIALATQTADECGMACCVKEGFCCCSPHHASVKGKVSDDQPRIIEADLLASSCPQGCAPASPFSKQVVRNLVRSAGLQASTGETPVIFFERVATIKDIAAFGSRIPRAPPSCSII